MKKSSLIKNVKYLPSTQVLTVEFQKGGNVFQYHNVPKTIFEGFLKAESTGKYFLANVKDKFEAKKII